MLEFQEDFFEQEVRDGFYISSTMKRVWAAELEVLQKVAEICDRHNIVWYAAYGTLLGAIRHEGFVPWDDDLDIWVKRNDYNRLIQILPEELPPEYEVRSPLLPTGYDQFHTLVNNGSFSMEEEHLRQYHGCPFSVGLDIFPLDYLPQNDAERDLQKNLVMLATRGAQVASAILRGEYEKADDPAWQKQAMQEELWDGIHYLEEICGVKIEHQLIENEKWYQVASEFGRWANYFAMMYREEESDCLVPYMDYVRWQTCRLPKEWFADMYGAAFEDFELPVPCGYEPLLRRIYGAYGVIHRKTGAHEYPGYTQQLRKLKEELAQGDQRLELLSNMVPECDLLAGEEKLLPPEWERHKRRILFINECPDARQMEKALERLDEVLAIFEQAQEHITLWWRPPKNMAERLSAVSGELAERYQSILERYKSADWGICDETDDPYMAAQWCDAYYGSLNVVLQPFQNAGKPILIAAMDKSWD